MQETSNTTTVQAGEGQAEPSRFYRNYVLAMLAISYAFSYMDRQIVSILLDDLKAEFTLTDTQLGLLSGLAFALFYSFLAIPIARLADRSSRIRIISISIFVWSLITALCGAVQNFTQLFLARMGVSVGEAGGLSPSHSVISDYFDQKARPLAISIFSLGTGVGMMTGLALGGYVAEHYGWRWAFVVAGAPGIAFALLFALTVKEPVRGRYEVKKAAEAPKQSFIATVKDLLANKPYMGILIGHLLVVFASYAISAWLPTTFARTYGTGQAETGRIIGMISLFGGAGGMFAGGALATFFARFDNRWQVRLPVIGLVIGIPAIWFGVQQDQLAIAAWIIGIGYFFYYMQHGPTLAVVQSCVKPHQRAQAASLVFFASNLLGLTGGPFLAGLISDMNVAELGEAAALSVSIQWVTLVALPAIPIFWWTAEFLKDDKTA